MQRLLCLFHVVHVHSECKLPRVATSLCRAQAARKQISQLPSSRAYNPASHMEIVRPRVPIFEIARLPNPDAGSPSNDKYSVLSMVASYRLHIGQYYFSYQGYTCYHVETREWGFMVFEGFKGGLHVYFVVRPAPVATVILNVHARLRLGDLEVAATMMSGREVFRASFRTDRDVRVSVLLLKIRQALLRGNIMQSSHNLRLLGSAGTLHLNSVLWKATRPKGRYEKGLLQARRRLVRKTDPRQVALAKVAPAF